jgi:transcriptional regulator with XRE-family HTH domain
MKTIGERIRQARVALQWSGEKLSKEVGYTHQSAIGNLENRAVGQGGSKLALIANKLNVSVDWLMNGPDCDHVPFLTKPVDVFGANNSAKSVKGTGPELFVVKSNSVWPFELFDFDGWMSLSQKDREDYENLIAGAVQRAQKIRGSK